MHAVSQKGLFDQVMVIGPDQKNLGRMSLKDAKILAEDYGLDLVKVGFQSDISVMRIMDEGKWKYEQKKRKKQKKMPTLKEMKFHINTDEHDIKTKVAHINTFIEKGNPVKIVVEMHGRYKNHSQNAYQILESIVSRVSPSIRRDSIKSSSSFVSVIIQPG